jgi:two-component system nitrate/nitrite sensor histidine kinase NarX
VVSLKPAKTTSASETDHTGFSWVRDPEFMPFGNDDARFAECLRHELVSPRAGELKTLLKTFLETIIGTTHAAAGVVRLLSPDGHTLQIMCSAGLSNELQKAAESFVDIDCEPDNIATLEPGACATYIRTFDTRQGCRHESSSFQSLVTASLEAPDHPGTSLGVLSLFFEAPREVASGTMNSVPALAAMMGAAIEYTRINRESHRTELLAERRVIANDIHDSLAQTLTFARMRISLLLEAIRTGNELAATKYTRDIDEALEISQKSARELITDFRSELNPGGLLASLEDLVVQFRERNSIVLEYQNRLVDLALPIEHEIQVYNILREALTNIGRHSGATHARLFVDANFGYYIFTVEDNGVGAHTFAPVEGHFGVMIMRERAHRIGGEIKVESAIGLGTQVQLFFPEPSPDWRSASE